MRNRAHSPYKCDCGHVGPLADFLIPAQVLLLTDSFKLDALTVLEPLCMDCLWRHLFSSSRPHPN